MNVRLILEKKSFKYVKPVLLLWVHLFQSIILLNFIIINIVLGQMLYTITHYIIPLYEKYWSKEVGIEEVEMVYDWPNFEVTFSS